MKYLCILAISFYMVANAYACPPLPDLEQSTAAQQQLAIVQSKIASQAPLNNKEQALNNTFTIDLANFRSAQKTTLPVCTDDTKSANDCVPSCPALFKDANVNGVPHPELGDAKYIENSIHYIAPTADRKKAAETMDKLNQKWSQFK